MSKRKANIRPDLIGELFLKPGEDIPYRLISCDTEPRALMAKVSEISVPNVPGLPISQYQDFVQLKPIRPIEKPKKPRADLGGTHKRGAKPLSKITFPLEGKGGKVAKRKVAEEVTSPLEGEVGKNDEPEIADKKGDNLTIHVPTGLDGDTEYKVTIVGFKTSGLTLKSTTLDALARWNGEIPDELNEYERATLQGILKAGE